MLEQDIYYIDGEFIPAGRAAIPVNDLALLRGYGVFDFLRTYGGRPFCVEEHISRLRESARLIGLSLPWSVKEVIEIVSQTLSRNDHTESNIRVVVTGGPSPDFITPAGRPRLLVLVTELQPFPREWYTDGVKVVTLPGCRSIPGAKTLNYLFAIIALEEARQQQAVEAVFIDRDGRVLEGQTTTVFAFIGGRLVTNQKGVLPGVTRGLILRLAGGEFETEIREFTSDELHQAEEVFLAATNKEIVPVIQVDDTIISGGKPGPRTRRIMELFRDYTRRFAAG